LQQVKKKYGASSFFSSLRIFSAPDGALKSRADWSSALSENKPCLKASVPSFSGAPCFSFIALAKPA